MMEKKYKISVNLSSNKNVSVTNTFMKWTFEAGRAIVVLIELVALGALGYRFLVDGQINDLHGDIDRQASLVEFQSADENKFRGIQERLTSIKIIDEETQAKVEIMNEVLSSITSGQFTDTNLSINKNSISLAGNALSVFTVENFVTKIQKYPQVVSIVIDEVNTTSNGIKFTTRITLQESKLEEPDER